MKSLRPKDTSCFFKRPLLVTFRDLKGRSEGDTTGDHRAAAICQYFTEQLLLENHKITERQQSSTHTALHLGALWLIPHRACQITSWKISLVETEIQKMVSVFKYRDKQFYEPLTNNLVEPNKRSYSCFYWKFSISLVRRPNSHRKNQAALFL